MCIKTANSTSNILCVWIKCSTSNISYPTYFQCFILNLSLEKKLFYHMKLYFQYTAKGISADFDAICGKKTIS